MDIALQQEIDRIRVVDKKRDYWFIRTYSGELYNYFFENNCIGLGFNNIPFQYIQEASRNDDATFTRLQAFIANNTEYKKGAATKWANQLISFDRELKIDDIVIIPNKSSDLLTFGIIESVTYNTQVNETFKFKDTFEPYPAKRKKVKWLKTISRDDFRGELNTMISNQNAVSNVNRYSDIIEGNLSSLYIKDKKVYLSILIDQDEEINAFALQRFLEGLTFLYKEFCLDYGIEENEELFIKIKVQSKGGVFLKGIGVSALLSIAGIIYLSSNQEVIDNLVKIGSTTGLVSIAAILALSDNTKVKLELGKIGKIEGQSAGFLKSLSNFLDGAQKRKIELLKFTQSIEQLKAKSIENPVTREQEKLED